MKIFDVPGGHLNYDIPEDKFLFLKLENEFVNMMFKVNPELKKYVQQ